MKYIVINLELHFKPLVTPAQGLPYPALAVLDLNST